jgi:DNA-binding FrmR family transcriptional regulator
MECPTKEDLLLHLVNDFEEPREEDAIPEHLEACPNCRGQARALERVIDNMQREGGRECDAVIAHLLDYLNGKVKSVEGVDLSEHLKECHACNTLQQNLAPELSYDEVMAFDFPLPDSLQHRIEKILAANSEPSLLANFIGSFINQVDEFVERITLILQPSPAPAFLGKVLTGTAQIETTATRDLIIKVGEAGRIVKLFSENDVELDRQISGPDGNVVFKDFVPATYKLLVEGFEIKDVDLWS